MENTYTPDLYVATDNYVGVSSLFTFIETMPPGSHIKKPYEMVDDLNSIDSVRLKVNGPVFNVEEIKT